jgi:2-polyprenyl-3-methyl-5-hydroxy-6-metoxy-1,4-benzoquinol methylase
MESSTEMTRQLLQAQMQRYRTGELVGIRPDEFKRDIEMFLRMNDATMEEFSDPKKQRDLSVKFHWGHDHDFGEFRLEGRMGNRHIDLLANFIEQFQLSPSDFAGKKVLDIGCWTGGTSLLLCALGASVVAVEEVKKYAEAVRYLKRAFGLKNLEVRHTSLFDCTTSEFQDVFDFVLFAGVLYHVTDPILALRITFNCLKEGGRCLLETYALDSSEPMVEYQGAGVLGPGSEEDLNRGGWNWFVPSPATLCRMMGDVGYQGIIVSEVVGARALAVGTRNQHCDMMRGGLSVRAIR